MTKYFKVCKACCGKKQLMGLGMMEFVDCYVCSGTGKIECDSNIINTTIEPKDTQKVLELHTETHNASLSDPNTNNISKSTESDVLNTINRDEKMAKSYSNIERRKRRRDKR